MMHEGVVSITPWPLRSNPHLDHAREWAIDRMRTYGLLHEVEAVEDFINWRLAEVARFFRPVAGAEGSATAAQMAGWYFLPFDDQSESELGRDPIRVAGIRGALIDIVHGLPGPERHLGARCKGVRRPAGARDSGDAPGVTSRIGALLDLALLLVAHRGDRPRRGALPPGPGRIHGLHPIPVPCPAGGGRQERRVHGLGRRLPHDWSGPGGGPPAAASPRPSRPFWVHRPLPDEHRRCDQRQHLCPGLRLHPSRSSRACCEADLTHGDHTLLARRGAGWSAGVETARVNDMARAWPSRT